MNDEPRSEQSITDNEKCRFLIELLLTDDWSDDFDFPVKLTKPFDKYQVHLIFGEYMHRLGLIKESRRRGMIYEVSVKGRKYLEQRS